MVSTNYWKRFLDEVEKELAKKKTERDDLILKMAMAITNDNESEKDGLKEDAAQCSKEIRELYFKKSVYKKEIGQQHELRDRLNVMTEFP